jgi:hypothetical protein
VQWTGGYAARFLSIFLALSFSCSQTESTPVHNTLTLTVGTPLAKRKPAIKIEVEASKISGGKKE